MQVLWLSFPSTENAETEKYKNTVSNKKATVVQNSRRAETRQNSNHSILLLVVFFLPLAGVPGQTTAKSRWVSHSLYKSIPTTTYLSTEYNTEISKSFSPLIYLFRTLKTFSWHDRYFSSFFFPNFLKTSWILTKSIGHDVVCSTQKKILVSGGHYILANIVRFGIFCWNSKTKLVIRQQSSFV